MFPDIFCIFADYETRLPTKTKHFLMYLGGQIVLDEGVYRAYTTDEKTNMHPKDTKIYG